VSHPGAILSGVENPPTLCFTEAARRLGAAARGAGLAVPAFRCPPRVPGVARTIRRYPGGSVVSVLLRGRPLEHVVSDMVEGVLVANQVEPGRAGALRALLRDAVADVLDPTFAPRGEVARAA
jgi:hypothetical protein